MVSLQTTPILVKSFNDYNECWNNFVLIFSCLNFFMLLKLILINCVYIKAV